MSSWAGRGANLLRACYTLYNRVLVVWDSGMECRLE